MRPKSEDWQYARYDHGKEHLSHSSRSTAQIFRCYLGKVACADGVDCNTIRKEAEKSVAHFHKSAREFRKLPSSNKGPIRVSRAEAKRRMVDKKKEEIYWAAIKANAKA